MSTSPSGYNRIQPLSPVERELFYTIMGSTATEMTDDDYLLVVRALDSVPLARKILWSDFADAVLGDALEDALDAYLFDDRWEDLRFPAITLNKGTANAPDLVKILDNGAGSQGVYTYLFDDAVEEEILFAVQLPHSWLEGSDLHLHFHWMPTSAAAGDVVWGIEYSWANIGDAYPATTLDTVVDSTEETADQHLMTSAIVIDATGKTASSMLMGRAYRAAADGDDTYGADAALLEVDFHYRVGSTGEVYIPSP